MRRHLKFLRDHRRELRLKVNAQEDLLLNGAREPSDRGACVHLLSKVDHAAVMGALERIDDPGKRRRLLHGVVQFTQDDGILLLYLEALADDASRAQAAGALPLAAERIDFAGLSAPRLARLLEVIATVFTVPQERASAVFGLLHSPSFRGRFQEAQDDLPADLKHSFVPLLAVYEAFVLGDEESHPARDIDEGVSILLTVPKAVMDAWPTSIQERVLSVALARMHKDEVADRAAGTLLEALPADSDAYLRGSLLRASALLRGHADARATWQLKQLRGAHPDHPHAADWLAALKAPRVGRIALRRGSDRKSKGLQAGFWLDEQRDVLIRIGKPDDAARFSREADVHRKLALPGLTPFLVAGKAEGGRPWIAIPALGRPAPDALKGKPMHPSAALWLCWQGVGLLGGVAASGWRLPDARSWRFLVLPGKRPTLLLADLSGIEPLEGDERTPDAHRGASFGWCRDVLRDQEVVPDRVARVLRRRKGKVGDLIRALALSLD